MTPHKSKQIEVQLDDGTLKTVLIKELSVGRLEVLTMDAIALPTKLAAPEVSVSNELKKFFQDQLLPLTTNITFDEMKKMYPSDLEEVWNGIQEVNKSFLGFLVRLNIVEWIKRVGQIYLQHLLSGIVSGQSPANSLKQDTPIVGTTDTPTL